MNVLTRLVVANLMAADAKARKGGQPADRNGSRPSATLWGSTPVVLKIYFLDPVTGSIF